MRWRRVIEYEGPPDWIERTLKKSIHGTMDLSGGCGRASITITEVSSQEITDDAQTSEGKPDPSHLIELGGESG